MPVPTEIASNLSSLYFFVTAKQSEYSVNCAGPGDQPRAFHLIEQPIDGV